jgi:bacillaene synthase trans-acting acyltransferase
MDQNGSPDYLLGSSLGEMVAAAIGGGIDPYEALASLITQAKAVEQKCQLGGMITILHDSEIYRTTPALYENAELISVNYSEHFTVVGGVRELQIVRDFLKKNDILYSQLPIQYAYHSALIEEAKGDFMNCLKGITFKPPLIPIVSSAYATQIDSLDEGYFWDVVRKPIILREALGYLESIGPHIYIDCSPSGTFKNLLNKVLPAGSLSICAAVMNPFGRNSRSFDQVARLLSGE